MSASINDKVTDTRNAARPNSARVSSGRSGGGTTLACDNLSGWPTASKVHFVTYRIDSSSNPVAGTQLDCYGIVSGNNIGSMVVVDGTDTGNAVNDVVEMLPTSAWGQDLADALTSQHSRTGAHGVITTTSINNAGTLTQTGVATFTAVPVLPASTITTANIQNAAVTADKLSTGGSSAIVATSQTSVSTSYADLGTVGPAVTVTIGANGLALVSIYCNIANNGAAADVSLMSFAVSGATTQAAADNFSLQFMIASSNFSDRRSVVFLLTGLTPGSTTFTAKYRVTANTGTWADRRIAVVPL